MATTTESGATRKRHQQQPTINQLKARVADLRKHVEKTADAVAQAAEWHTEQGLGCTADNLREAKYEHGLAKSGLRRAEQQLEEALKGGTSR